MFAIRRKGICRERVYSATWKQCFGTHMKIEEMIAEDESSDVILLYYIKAIWSTMNDV